MTGVAVALLTFYVDAERLGRVRQIGRLHPLRRLADLELDIVVLKTIGGDRGFDGEIDVCRIGNWDSPQRRIEQHSALWPKSRGSDGLSANSPPVF
jgi:hypothetical protein